VYNGEAFVGRAIESIIAQSFEDWELIITDNCSTDTTEKICRRFANQDSRVQYIRNENNLGVIANFNKVFGFARGEYFKWAASDDICHPELVAKLVAALENNQHAVLAVSNAVVFEEWPIETAETDSAGQSIDYDQRIFSTLSLKRMKGILQSDHPGTLIYGLIRSSALRDSGLHQFDGSDRLLLTELALQGEYVLVREELFYRRIYDLNVDRSRREYVKLIYGSEHSGLLTPPWRWPFNYIKTVYKSDQSAVTKLRATAAIVGHSFRPRFLRKFFMPGPENYWGITRDKLRLVHIL
jgi:glycosyltransferase involved in cell wall biosynthesis